MFEIMQLIDKYGRIHDYLRISITDKCNYNCFYCNPINSEKNFEMKDNLLTYSEINRLVKFFVQIFEFKKIRITGGEPFVRKNIQDLFELMSKIKKENPFELAITTNGSLFNGFANKFNEFGIDRVNFSLDSLNPEKYARITGRNNLKTILKNIEEAVKINPEKIKINIVVMQNVNDYEIFDFIEYGKNIGCCIRFIEYMPFSDNQYSQNNFISSEQLREMISEKYELIPLNINISRVSKDYFIENINTKVGFISPISEKFCGSCNRLRITAAGKLKLCLFSANNDEVDLKTALRSEYSDDEIIDIIMNSIIFKEYSHPELNELITLKNNNIISIGG